jgi:diadenosine tetraphosphate (Ap4A) HIT family hydrolase
MSCIFCNNSNEELVIKNDIYKVIKVFNQDYPIYFQLVINQHIKELSDLPYQDALKVFDTIYLLDKLICEIYNVDKVNIASFGNIIPHLHWHIIGRYKHDKHFPNPIWGEVVHQDYQANNFDQLFIRLKDILNSK